MDRVLVKLYVPMFEKKYEMWIPANKKIGNIIVMITKAISEMSGGYYKAVKKMPMLYNKETSEKYDVNITIKESSIRSGTELVLM